jgi:hypothetical protein
VVEWSTSAMVNMPASLDGGCRQGQTLRLWGIREWELPGDAEIHDFSNRHSSSKSGIRVSLRGTPP